MNEKIEKLMKTFEDLRFDSLIFIFGFGDGEYLDALLSCCCERNIIYIVEPNLEDVYKYKNNIDKKNVFLIAYDEEKLEILLRSTINSRNFVNLFVDKYGDYDERYKDEYNKFINLIDTSYYSVATFLYTNKSFKNIFIDNIFSNIDCINESTSLDLFMDYNKDIPAIIVSAGPSLDRNIKEMIKFKEKLKNFFIVAGNRTLKPLLDNGITPDVIVSIDPQEVTYNMLKEILNVKIPLVFYEQSNSKLVAEYEGDKIFTTQGLFTCIKGLENMSICFSGGSVAHCSTDIAVKIGCNPIIFAGQDFGYTYDKHHAEIAKLDIDKDINNLNVIKTKDVFGNEILTDRLLNLYRKNMEFYIKYFTKFSGKSFLNVSYGADIEGAEFKELSKLLNEYNSNNLKKTLKVEEKSKIDVKTIKTEVFNHIENTIVEATNAAKICEEITEEIVDENTVKKFAETLQVIDRFVKNPNSLFFKGYLEEFLFNIKEKYFKMSAKEYPILTNNLIYQSKVFSSYFKELIKMLKEVKIVIEPYIDKIDV
ncbi:motility associated factor glycosyltransferase family protein [Clostridium intestinale]|uniref:Motility associated factor glycosyltransferase family protein n=1 Tax=Clostridium intestinale TaxID=36845 RepID=A0A7D6VTS9_9CLOT|nr:6-hydroxymethylpterin diphosphokinase MptE-like protein [Clostridium intestinale]QLY79750.1 motility associated factor glycosyltransferase family protein [Clostridium intestinale]